MTAWPVVRVTGPGSIGLALVVLRPSWVSVAVLGMLLIVAMWFDGQERRADDVEALEEQVNSRLTDASQRLQVLEIANDRAVKMAETVAEHDRWLHKDAEKLQEISQRLDATAQQRKGPSL